MAAAGLLGLHGSLTSNSLYAGAVLLIVGMAWSTQVVSASAWLTDALPHQVRPRAEGIGEAGMAIAAAAGGVSAVPLIAAGGTFALLTLVLAVTATAGLTAARARGDTS
jgi:hypothetical protein